MARIASTYGEDTARMSLLSRIESAFTALIEGGFRRALSPRLQPVDVARALERVMLGQKMGGLAFVDVPNRYLARLNPGDFEQLASARGAVEREAAAYLDRRADEEGFRPVGRIQVSLVADPEVARSTVRGEAQFEDEPADVASVSEIEQTRRFEPVGSAVASGVLVVAAEDGKELYVGDRPVRIGRGID